jgi:uncharacterized protein YjbI with pentapeptide repeats
MANPEHLKLLRQGVDVWNALRKKEGLDFPDLREADLRGADLSGADLLAAQLFGADLREANLHNANLLSVQLSYADLSGANLSHALILNAFLDKSKLTSANLYKVSLAGTSLREADLSEANLLLADLFTADLSEAKLCKANLVGASLNQANLRKADFSWADLSGADLSGALLIETNLENAILSGCGIYGISAWNVKLGQGTKQQGLVITERDEPALSVDNIEVAQFVYLLLHNEKIRDVIDTVGKKGVLLLGRFTQGRIMVLERLREELRKRGYLPIVFNFDKPETKDFTETVRLLAGLSKFVIADITNPKSSPLELQATVPEIMVPFQPIIAKGEKPFAMLKDLQRKHDWVFKTLRYSSLDRLIETMGDKIINPAEAKFKQLVARRAEPIEDEEV